MYIYTTHLFETKLHGSHGHGKKYIIIYYNKTLFADHNKNNITIIMYTRRRPVIYYIITYRRLIHSRPQI